MTSGKKATYVVELREGCPLPEFSFDEIQRLIEKHMNVVRVTRTEGGS